MAAEEVKTQAAEETQIHSAGETWLQDVEETQVILADPGCWYFSKRYIKYF